MISGEDPVNVSNFRNMWLWIPIHTYTYLYIPIHTYTYLYIPIHTYTYLYIPIHTYTYLYIPIHTYTYLCRKNDAEIGVELGVQFLQALPVPVRSI